ncbi:EVE domain-containing protein [Enterococcus sp. LJL51]|uniref:EVE domain-containing protein n=1 Tax=Enterococcus sp. LJL51 TaxID=3416656 RepID=UPI003CEAB4AB
MRYWLGVASKEHVEIGVAGGFSQLCHGKQAPLNRMKEGDWLIYYAPKESLKRNEPCQKFIAVGTIKAGCAYQVEMKPNFFPFRKNVSYLPNPYPVSLQAVSDYPLWSEYRSKLRFGHLEIPQELFEYITFHMFEA